MASSQTSFPSTPLCKNAKECQNAWGMAPKVQKMAKAMTRDESSRHRCCLDTNNRVFVRIRPLVETGVNTDGEGVAKMLENWSKDSVTLSSQYLLSREAMNTSSLESYHPNIHRSKCMNP